MEKNLIFVILAVFILSFGCLGVADGNVSSGRTGVSAPGYDSGFVKSPSVGESAGVQDQMVIKTGSAVINVPEKTLTERYEKLKELSKQYGGEVFSSSYYESDSGKSQYVTVKINSKDFDVFSNRLSEIGTIKSFSSNTEDVTQQYIDVTARLNNLETSRDRLLALYNMSANLSDIIALEREITNLQYQIDSTTQQKLYYERQSAKASISITLSEPAPVVDKSILDPFSQLLNMFLGGFMASLILVVAGLGFIIPLAIVLFVLWKIAAFIWSKIKKSKK